MFQSPTNLKLPTCLEQKFSNGFRSLRQDTSWASRYGAVETFFVTPTKTMFLVVLWEYLFIMLSELRFVK